MIGADIEVSNSHEPSYYEIALTNRQVVVAFVILLVCLLSAFFSGVWIGRESTMRAQEQLAQATTTGQQEPSEGQALEEFEFFGDAQKPAQPEPEPEPVQPATPTPEPAADSTLLEDFGGQEDGLDEEPPADLQEVRAEPDQVVMPTEEERRRARRAERAAAERTAPAPAQPERRADREEPVRPKPLPEAAPATAAASTPAARGAVIQVFSSAEKDQAERIRDRLVRGGHKAFLSPVEVAGRTMYRVRIGPFESRGKADEVAGQVRKGFKLDTWVTE